MPIKTESYQLDAIIKALCAAKREFGGTNKDKKADRYKYTSLEVYLDAINEALMKHEIWFDQTEQYIHHESGPKLFLVTSLRHSSGQFIKSIAPLKDVDEIEDKRSNALQAYGSQLTYRRRYALMAILGLAPEDDDDGAAVSYTPRKSANSPTIGSSAMGGDGYKHNNVATNGATLITKEQIELLESQMQDLPELKARFLKSRNITSLSELPSTGFPDLLRLIQDRAKTEREVIQQRLENERNT